MYSDISNSLRTTIMTRYVWQMSKNLEWNEHTKWEREKTSSKNTYTHLHLWKRFTNDVLENKTTLNRPNKNWNEMTCARNNNNHKSIAAFLSSYFEKRKWSNKKKLKENQIWKNRRRIQNTRWKMVHRLELYWHSAMKRELQKRKT